MSDAVEVLIVESATEDGTARIDPAWRACLEHEPALHTIGEADLFTSGATRAVALAILPDPSPKAEIARLAALKERHPALRIIVAFQRLGADDLARLLGLGADALIARSAPPRDVCAAILDVAQASAPAPGARSAETSDGLTAREAEILRFLSSGFSNKEVARRLGLSVRTVETHRLNLRRKTQTGRLKDLVSLARQLGLAPVMEADPARRANAAPKGAVALATH